MNFPRRSSLQHHTPAELIIRNAVDEVEKVGAHPLLTDAVNLLDAAREKVADFVDGIERKPDPRDERIKFLESEIERLKSGLDDIEQIVFAQRLKKEVENNVLV